MADITVTIFNNSDDGTLKITWSMGSTDVFYHVKFTRIETRAREIREALQALVDAGRDKSYDKYDELVRNLARAGNRLYEALLFGESAEDKVEADRARHWIETYFQGGRDVMTFRLPSRMHFPWGLIYDHEVEDNTAQEEIKKHFWCVKFSVTVHYFINRLEWAESPWPAKKFGLLFGADEKLWTDTSAELRPTEKERLLALLGQPPEPKFNLDDLSKQWREQRTEALHGLLAFYCHANGSELSIGGRTLSADDFEEMFEHKGRLDSSPPTLVFLAGCKTGVSELNKGFFRATAASGYCGFIGTEVKVPDIFTLRFVTHFLDRFFGTGQTVGEVMSALRMQHWPLSLVFSVCCSVNLRLEPSPGAIMPDVIFNLSTERVSTG